MRAKMKDNLIDWYEQVLPGEVDEDLVAFLKTIEGKEVNLVFVHGDAFEETDKNFWLPPVLWDAI